MLKICQCVRNFSPYGGMEGYVWNLAHKLVEENVNVLVVCEEYHNDYNTKIQIKLVDKLNLNAPSWSKHLFFSQKVKKLFQREKHLIGNYIIHSHERLSIHHVTTIHGPLIMDRKKSLLDFFSLRLFAWKFIEKREFFSHNVSFIFPNSYFSRNKLNYFYPNIKAAICAPGYPGINEDLYKIENKNEVFNIGFIGKEWKRKGLLFVIDVYREIYKYKDNIHLHIAGVNQNDVKKYLEGLSENSYTFYGWTDSKTFFEKIELILHPAINEPFGMVLSEANASGVYCLISENVGFKDFIGPNVGEVLALDKKLWVDSILKLIGKKVYVNRIQFSWLNLAKNHIKIYKIIDRLNNN